MFINPKTIRTIEQNMNWIITALIFFLIGIFAAIFVSGNEEFFLTELTESQHEFLQEMADMIFSGSPLKGISLLFVNNLLASLRAMLFGIFLGLPPLMGLFTNGALLGTLVVELGRESIPAFTFISVGILPHGIFELPAFLISASFGLKTGFHLLFPFPQKKRIESLKIVWREFFTVFPLIIFLLLIASVIEVVLTPLLVQKLILLSG
ncbi:MAG: stage II sporulation protein M [Firmicutes bacterium]|nr:stage II sporulation protein M [Bacillota bacterium]